MNVNDIANDRVIDLPGTIKINGIPGAPVYRVKGQTTEDLYADLSNEFNDATKDARVVVLQYTPGDGDSFEAGSRWFDYDGDASNGAAGVLIYIREMDDARTAGETFLP